MTPLEGIESIRKLVESRGPDTTNRHYGRKQYDWIMECCDTIRRALSEDIEDLDLSDLLRMSAEQPIEDMDDVDELAAMWLTADDIASRLRARLHEERYWWSATG